MQPRHSLPSIPCCRHSALRCPILKTDSPSQSPSPTAIQNRSSTSMTRPTRLPTHHSVACASPLDAGAASPCRYLRNSTKTEIFSAYPGVHLGCDDAEAISSLVRGPSSPSGHVCLGRGRPADVRRCGSGLCDHDYDSGLDSCFCRVACEIDTVRPLYPNSQRTRS